MNYDAAIASRIIGNRVSSNKTRIKTTTKHLYSTY